jgi:hypothetical protein
MPGLNVELERRVLRFVQQEAGFAQVVTVSRMGFPIGRTMGAAVADDWSVTLVQRNAHKRIGQLRRSPRLEIIWTGSPAPTSTNDRPRVYDFGLLIPRVVFLRGAVEFLDERQTILRYRKQTAALAAKGLTRAPQRSDENIATELIGIHVHPIQVRAEGFGDGAESFTWTIGRATGN